MGVLSAFITTTCSKLLLWFVLLLMPRLRPKPIQLFSMELTAMLVMLPHTHTAMPDIHMPTPTLPDTPMVLTHMPTELTHMPTELTTERDPLMPSQRLMPTTDTTDMPDHTPTDMPHTLMELTHTVMDMPGESKLFQPKVLSYCKPKAQ